VASLRAPLLVGLTIFGGVTVWSPGTAASAPAMCGRPEDAPGFEIRAEHGVIPDVVCMDLQMAQDKAQAAEFFEIRSDDASGRRRAQFSDRDWVVVAQTPAAGTHAPPPRRLYLRVLAYGDPGAPPVPDRSRPGRMPNLACFDLQEAQDTLQSAGFTTMASHDATGRGRAQFYDRNWTVTGQSPAPGGIYGKRTRVLLQTVKDGEPSPC
jgi:hypothetical protein